MAENDQLKTRIWKKSKWGYILAILLGAVPAYLVPFYFTTIADSPITPNGILMYTIIWGGIMSLILILILRYVNDEKIRELNLKTGKVWKDILMGLGLMVVTLGFFMLTRNLFTDLFPSQESQGLDPLFEELINNPRFFLLMTGPGLLIGAGIFEELTRVFLLSRFWKIWDKKIWRWVTVVFSAMLFGLMHWYQGPAGVVSTGISGMIMAVFYLRFGRVLPMMIAHYLHDAFQFITIYLMFK
jgi:hypothetical protein